MTTIDPDQDVMTLINVFRVDPSRATNSSRSSPPRRQTPWRTSPASSRRTSGSEAKC